VSDLSIHGPNNRWPAAPRARGIVARHDTIYAISQVEEFDPTDPFSNLNGVNCYPFPFPRQTCGTLVAIDALTLERTLLADLGDPSQADPNLPSARSLGAWPVAGVVQGSNLLIVDKDYPTTFGVRNPRLGALWRVAASGPTAGTRSIVSDFADATQGPFGADPFSIARGPDGRIYVLDRSPSGPGLVDCNTSPGSPPVGCGALFLVDQDGTRHLLNDLGDSTEVQTTSPKGG